MSDLPTKYTGPGLIDLQVNGYGGVDFNGEPDQWRADSLHRIRQALEARGLGAILPTLMTDDVEIMFERARRYAALVERDKVLAGFFPGLHIEGPFLSASDGPRGAHSKKFCRTPREIPEFLDRLQEASGGRVALLTLAPELGGAIELIRRCAEAGVCPAIGHTEATKEQIDQAVAAGAKFSTHLGNGSHLMLPKLDNYLETQLAEDRLWASFIADGHHIPFHTLKNFLRAKTPARSVLVSDAMVAAGCGPGHYEFAGETVEVSGDGRVAKPGATNLAGSTLTLDHGVINAAIHCDVSFQQAWAMASTNPAKLLGFPPCAQVAVSVSRKGFCRRP